MSKYVCRLCGKKFNTLHELGTHVRSEKAQLRKSGAWRPQLTPPSSYTPNPYKILRIQKAGNSRRLSVTKLLPEDWNIIKAHTVKMNKDEIWIHVERLG